MHTMHTPFGKLTAHSIPQDTQSILLAGEYHGYPFHIYATQPSNPSQLDYPFYTQILNNLPPLYRPSRTTITHQPKAA